MSQLSRALIAVGFMFAGVFGDLDGINQCGVLFLAAFAACTVIFED